MADIAAIFHWTPDEMNKMDLEELMEWREQARVRSTPEDED